MYLAVWSNAVVGARPDGKPVLATLDDVYPGPGRHAAADLGRCTRASGSPHESAIPRNDAAPRSRRTLEAKRESQDESEGFANARSTTLTTFYDSLPRVRRALANVPTYMVFDDHDVTDDWNLSRAWRDRVFTAPLGRRVITNALVAYVALPGLGQRPAALPAGAVRRAARPAREPLSHATGRAGRSRSARSRASSRSSSASTRPTRRQPAPKLKWHFTVDGPRHRVVALDTRTRRAFRSRYLPPALLSPKALKEQLPDPREQPLPAGVEVLVVVSQTPPVLPSIATR